MINKKETEETLKKLREMYKDNAVISDILNSIEVSEYNKVNSAWKILSNPRIMSTINLEKDIDLLESIIKEDDDTYKNICKLVRSVYGEDAEKIVLERPELSMDDVPNFDIFDEKIREVIGDGGVNNFLRYYMSSEQIISELAQNPELIRYYKKFEILTKDFFPPSAIGLEDRLLAFNKHRELIKAIVDSQEQDEYKDNLLLMLRDEEGYVMLKSLAFNPNEDLRVNTLEGLLKYREKREIVLQTCIDESTNSPSSIRSTIMFKYFGIIKDLPGQYDDYDHKKFLQDYLQFNKTELSEDEVDLIEIYSILEGIENTELLLQIDRELSSSADVVTPLRMKTIDAKVVENYKREFMDSLIKLEQARQMAEDSESKSYRYICKKNGDIWYPNRMVCGSDGSTRYKNCLVQEDGTRLTQYKGANGEEITKKVKVHGEDTIESYEIKNMLIVPNDGSAPYRRDIQVTLKNGELYEYFWPTHDANERYGLRKKVFYNKDDDGHEREYAYTYTTPSNGEDGYFVYNITDGNHGWKENMYNTDQVISKRRLYYAEHHEKDSEFIESVGTWRDSVESYLKDLVQVIDRAHDEIQEDSYFQLIPQYNPDEVELEEGDVEGFVLYGVKRKQLCISMQRGIQHIPDKLKENKLLKGKMDHITDQEWVYMEKYMEGGISTRSSYYYFDSAASLPGYGIGLGISEMNPNAIIGFSTVDADASHEIKQLRAFMGNHSRISDLSTKQSELADSIAAQGEVVTSRYESDGRRSKIGYVFPNGKSLKEVIEIARQLEAPIMEFEEIQEDSGEPIKPRRTRRPVSPGSPLEAVKKIVTAHEVCNGTVKKVDTPTCDSAAQAVSEDFQEYDIQNVR